MQGTVATKTGRPGLGMALVAVTTAAALNTPGALLSVFTISHTVGSAGDEVGIDVEPTTALWIDVGAELAINLGLAVVGVLLIRRHRIVERLRTWQTAVAVVVGLPVSVGLAFGSIKLAHAIAGDGAPARMVLSALGGMS